VVEHWNSYTNTRKDLFGLFDILALGKDEIIGIQVTSASNVSKRIRKIEDSPLLGAIRESGMKIEVHGWRKYAKQKDGKWWRPTITCLS
jgi:hypothetical protein